MNALRANNIPYSNALFEYVFITNFSNIPQLNVRDEFVVMLLDQMFFEQMLQYPTSIFLFQAWRRNLQNRAGLNVIKLFTTVIY
jgi:hypothetical protein